MSKSISQNKFSPKKVIKIILFIPLILIGILLLYIAWGYVSDPILDRLDHDKFAKLDTQMQGVFKKLKTVSNGADVWNYSTSCNVELTGDWATGMYDCTALINTEKTVSTVQEVNDLQTKYYPIINDSSTLKQKTELDLELPNDFGKNFVVSGAERKYIEVKSGIKCTYLIKLGQTNNESDAIMDSDNYGSVIENQNGNLRISLTCFGVARDYWYTISNPAQLGKPGAPLKKS